jgi:hypothetical protein
MVMFVLMLSPAFIVLANILGRRRTLVRLTKSLGV